ncbi:hypothetical protein ACI8AF_25010 [Blastococcus sp. SYSU D00669]
MTGPHDPADGGESPADEQADIHLADWLSPEQADEALRIFAALRATRRERAEQAGESGAPMRSCSVLLADDTPCLLPLPHNEHRQPAPEDEGRASP